MSHCGNFSSETRFRQLFPLMLINGKPNISVADKTAVGDGAESELVAADELSSAWLTFRCFAAFAKFPGRLPTTADIERSRDDGR